MAFFQCWCGILPEDMHSAVSSFTFEAVFLKISYNFLSAARQSCLSVVLVYTQFKCLSNNTIIGHLNTLIWKSLITESLYIT